MAAIPFISDAVGRHASQCDYSMLLDMGCTKTVCYIIKRENTPESGQWDQMHGVDIAGAGHMARRVPCASGIAELPDQKVIQKVISQAEEMAAQQLASLYISVPGQHIIFRNYVIDLALNGLPVDEDDIRACLREGRRRAAAAGEIPLHVWPIGWSVDAISGLRDPRGLRGMTLRVEFTSAACSEFVLKAFRDRLAQQHRTVAGFIAAPYASSTGMLLEEELVLGTLYIDIGSHYTNFIVIDDRRILAMGAIPVGGDLITKDIARAFSITLADAESLKIRHGTASLSPRDAGRRYEVPQIASPHDAQVITAEHLCQVIEARLHEIADLVRTEVLCYGVNFSHIRRLVMGGGSSLIDGVEHSMGRYLGMAARTGHPLGVRDAPDIASGPAFAAGVGMAECVINPPHPDLAPMGSVECVMAALLGAQRSQIARARGGIKGAAIGKITHGVGSVAQRVKLGGVSNWLRTHF